MRPGSILRGWLPSGVDLQGIDGRFLDFQMKDLLIEYFADECKLQFVRRYTDDMDEQ